MTLLQILVAARWMHFGALFVLFGAPLSYFLARGADALEVRRLGEHLDILLRIAAVTAAISGLLWLATLLASMVGGFTEAFAPGTIHTLLFETRFGPVVMVRLALLGSLLLAMMLPRGTRPGVWLIVSAGLLIDQAWLGHAANGGATCFGAATIGVYVVHVLAGATWIGGMPVLILALCGRSNPAACVNFLARYSRLATLSVMLILMTGIANAIMRTRSSLIHLSATSYGEILLAKILLLLLMLALAGYNRFVAMPGVEKDRRSCRRLSISIAAEFALGALIIGAAALLGVTPPPE